MYYVFFFNIEILLTFNFLFHFYSYIFDNNQKNIIIIFNITRFKGDKFSTIDRCSIFYLDHNNTPNEGARTIKSKTKLAFTFL